MWPLNTREYNRGFLGPKYEKIRSITLADAPSVYIDGVSDDEEDGFVAPYFGPTEPSQRSVLHEDIAHIPITPRDVMAILEGLPAGFTKDYDYGLGLAFKYRFIVEAVERLSDSSAVTISRYTKTQINTEAREFLISFTDFEKARKSINNASNLANAAVRSVNRARVTNLLASQVGGGSVAVSMGRHPMRKRITEVAQGGMGLTDGERDELLTVFSDNADAIAKKEPISIGKLRNDIELVTLGQLIDRFAARIGRTDDESTWQEFLNENPFVLSLAFGYPIMKIGGGVTVGGRRIDGGGDKITDFLVKNSMTNNTAVVEIKKPSTLLLNKSEYRPGIFGPSSDLTSAINQVLDQKRQLESEIHQLRSKSRMYDLESHSVHCCLIVGCIPAEYQQKRCFEMFRGNSKSVAIVTFDELLNKLKNLHKFLITGEIDDDGSTPDDDLPF